MTMQTISDTVQIETDCTITAPNGATFSAGGAMISPAYAIAYCAGDETIPTPERVPSGEIWRAQRPGGLPPIGTDRWRGTLVTWHGEKVGNYWLVSRERRGQFGETYYRISARINGIDYYGMTQGPGMIAKLTAYRASLRRYNAREDMRRLVQRGDDLYTRIVWTSRDNLRWHARVYVRDPAATDGAYMDITETVAHAIGWDYRDGVIVGGGVGVDRASQLTYDVSGELFRDADGKRDGYAIVPRYHPDTMR